MEKDEFEDDQEFTAYGFLKKPVSIDEAERLETVTDDTGDWPAAPFGYLWETWKRFLLVRNPDSELWAYERPREYSLNGEILMFDYSRGYCWVKNGKIEAELAVEGGAGYPFIDLLSDG